MMKKIVCFWVPLILFIAVSCWWTTYFPYNRELLYRAVPLSSDIIIEQQGLHDIWSDESVQELLMENLELLPDVAGKLIEDGSRLDSFIKAAASRNTIIARVPALSAGARPAVVIASWAGRRGQFVKWGAGMLPESRFKQRIYNYGVPLWSMRLPGDNMYFSFTFFEGVLAGCISGREFGVDYIADRMINSRPLAPVLERKLKLQDNACGFFMTQNAGNLGTQIMRYDIDRSSSGRAAGRFAWSEGNPFSIASSSPGHAQSCRDAASIIGNSPGAVLFAPYQFLELQLMKADPKGRSEPLRRMLRQIAAPDASVCLSMSAPEYSGRVRGLRVPSFMLAVKVAEPGAFMDSVPSHIDALNASYRLSLIPAASTFKGHRIYSIDQVTGELFAKMGSDEKPSICMIGDWLILASNLGFVHKLIEYDTQAGGRLDSFDFSSMGSVAMWVDPEAVDAGIPHMIAVNDLMFPAGSKRRHNTFRNTMSALQKAVHALQGVESITILTKERLDKTELIWAAE